MAHVDGGTTQICPVEYHTNFADEKKEIFDYLIHWHRAGGNVEANLDRFESMVAVKNTKRILTMSNLPFRTAFAGGRSVVGRGSETVLSGQVSSISGNSDQLLIDGVEWLEMEHLDYWDGVDQCLFVVHKRRLDEIKDPDYAILVISRVKSKVIHADQRKVLKLTEIAAIINQLGPIDLAICRGCERGDSLKEIAASVNLTTRSVENHRQRIMESLGFTRPVEIVKVMVRLEENGLLGRPR
jgi:hypothetical protein